MIILFRVVSIVFLLSFIGNILFFIRTGDAYPASVIGAALLSFYFYLKGWKNFSLRKSLGINFNSYPKTSYSNQTQDLEDLFKDGILNKNEYVSKLNQLKKDQFESDLKKSDNYKKLEALKNRGVLTDHEFEQKVKLLRELKSNKLNEISSTKESDYYEVYRLFNPLTKNLEVFSLSDIKREFEQGNYLFSPTSSVTIIRDDDFNNPIIVNVKEYEPFKEFSEYFPPEI